MYFKFVLLSRLLQQQLPILVEEEDAEGTMQHPPRRAGDETVRQVLVYVSNDLVVFVQCDYLWVDDRQRNEGLSGLRIQNTYSYVQANRSRLGVCLRRCTSSLARVWSKHNYRPEAQLSTSQSKHEHTQRW